MSLKIILFNLIILSPLFSFSQLKSANYLINFDGFDEKTYNQQTYLDSVKIENISQSKNITLLGTDTLQLYSLITSTNPDIEYPYSPVKIYPNPFADHCTFEFGIKNGGLAVLAIYNIVGNTIIRQKQYLSNGKHAFQIEGLNKGIYILKISCNDYSFQTKLISYGKQCSNLKISYIGLVGIYDDYAKLKNVSLSKNMLEYNFGDSLKFTGIRSNCKIIIPDIPKSSKTMLFDFSKCSSKEPQDTLSIYCNEFRNVLKAMPITPKKLDCDIYNAWMQDFVKRGFYSKCLVADIFTVENAQNSLINWRSPGKFNPSKIENPTFTSYQGWNGNSITGAMLNSNFNPKLNAQLISKDNICIVIGIGNDIAEDNFVFGGIDGRTNIYLNPRSSNDNIVSMLNDGTVNSNHNSLSSGHFALSRSTSQTYNQYFNKTKSIISISSIDLLNREIGIGGMINEANSHVASNRQIRYFMVFQGLSESEVIGVTSLMEKYLIRPFNSALIPPTILPITTVWPSIYALLHSSYNKNIYVFGADHNYLGYNEGGGAPVNYLNWTAKYYDINKITAARIASNGNLIVFSDNTVIHYSTDKGLTYKLAKILNKDGTPYVFHKPINPNYPGGYFYQYLDLFEECNGIIVIGNYSNVFSGASPCLLWYSVDGGATWKVLYEFGQNSSYKDDGTPQGGPTGNFLGNQNSQMIARHVHGLNSDKNGNFWASTGESGYELHWLKLSYDKSTDHWNITDFINEDNKKNKERQRMRAINLYEYDGYIYWGSDGSSPSLWNGKYLQSLGIWRVKTEEVNDLSKHELLFNSPTTSYSFKRCDNYILSGFTSGYENINKLLFSTDNGKHWTVINKSDNIGGWKIFYDRFNNRFVYGWHAIFSFNF